MKFFRSQLHRNRRRQFHAPQRKLRRPFLGELLEDRALMNVDTGGVVAKPFHNVTLANDVNVDGKVTNLDALLCIRDLQVNGPRVLYSANSGYVLGEGESAALLVDVNGDNQLTNLDAVLIINALRAEAQGESAAFDLSFLDSLNAAIPDNTLLNVGDSLQLLVTAQDIRAALPPNLPSGSDFGLFSAYLNVDFNAAAVDAVDADLTSPGTQLLNFKPLNASDPQYSQVATDQRGVVDNSAGTISNAGAVQDFFGGPLGPDPVTLWRAKFDILEAPPLIASAAAADGYVLPSGQAATLDVLANDSLWGVLTFTASPATDPGSEVITYSPAAVVEPNDIAYDAASVRVASDVTITNVSGPVPSGSVIIQGTQGNQTLLYTPVAGFSGTVTFNYTITGSGGGTSTSTVTLLINNPPIANNDTYAINTDSTNNQLKVLDNDTTAPDVSDVIAITDIPVLPQHGSVTVAPDSLSVYYTPDPGFAGTDTFVYEVTDGDGLSDTATVTLNVAVPVNEVRISAEAFVNGVSVNAVEPGQLFDLVVYVEDIRPNAPQNDPDLRGVASAYLDVYFNSSYFTYLRDTLTPSPFTDNLDVEFDPAFFTDPPLAEVGPLTSNATGDADPNRSGLLDEIGSFQQFSLGQTEFPPLGSGKTPLFTVHMQAGTTLTSGVLFDLDPADTAGNDITIAEPAHDVPLNLVVFQDLVLGIVTFSPNVPVAVDDAYSMLEDGVLNITAAGNLSGDGNALTPLDAYGVLNNDLDADAGTTLTAQVVNGPAHGALTLNTDGTFTYTPAADYFGTDSFTYRAGDDAIRSNLATVSIFIERVPEAPVATPDSYNLNTNTTLVVGAPGVLGNDTNPETGSTIIPMVVSGPSHGTLLNNNLNADGSFTYTPATDFFGVDSFTYHVVNVTDNLTSNTVTVTFFVGIVAGSVSGTVYADVNANGLLDKYATGANMERTLGGVTLQIVGTDALGAAVNRTTTSAHDGSYSFGNVLPGFYTVSEVQPKFMVDRFVSTAVVNLKSGENRASVNFAEFGLTSEFDGSGNTFSSTDARGIWVAFNAAGQLEWYAYANGWGAYRTVSATLSADRQFAILRVTDASGVVFVTSMVTVGNTHFRLLGSNAQGTVARFDGLYSDFAFVEQTTGAGGEGLDDYTAAVDAIFGEE